MNMSPDGTTLEVDGQYLDQLFAVRDRFHDRVEGNAQIDHDDGRSYNVHLYANVAFRMVDNTDGVSCCIFTTLKYRPRESEGQFSSCTISSETPHHRLIRLPSAGGVRAAVLSEEEIPMFLLEDFLARSFYVRFP
ncbi:uncharacterized protein MELLADRAFT_104466 [Melampsora larici-populina 98AG31]|uniref:Uncharacterized protein n=1 Tax=Melampsora larici-populina (strain 98AG31 / pathotype 3-4-7) TaxID=747676 RepID=F4RES7_MELLP|nr:uncharacterized protein MELLADRAFT_104466 [Melampsora larici-populina 98AG31]EGG09151.1 hypothetical protein MELLADRAFT_104466 [Melampsora larici-populina 98AG31]